MKEEFFINGVLMETKEDDTFSLVFQSPLWTEINNIVSNYTSTISFPLTATNRKAIGYADNLQVFSEVLYSKYPAVYKRDGVELFSGTCNILSITDTDIKVNFVWGNENLFAPLFDKKLEDLQTDSADDYVMWDDEHIKSDEHFCSVLDEGEGKVLPILSVYEIMQRIAAVNRLNFVTNINMEVGDLVIPLTRKRNDASSAVQNAMVLTSGSLAIWNSSGSSVVSGGRGASSSTRLRSANLIPSETDIDLNRYYIDEGIYDTEEAVSIFIKVAKGMQIRTPKETINSQGYIVGMNYSVGLCVYACDADGQNSKLLQRLGTYTVESGETYDTYTLTTEIREEVNVEQYSYIHLCVVSNSSLLNSMEGISVDNLSLQMLETNANGWGGVPFNSLFPLWYNLPDMTQGDFIKNIFKMRGMFPYTMANNRTIYWLKVQEKPIYGDDWSDKVVTIKPTTIQPSFADFAITNFCKYAEDESVTKNYNSAIMVNNSNLEKEKDLITLDFAATQDNKIPLWVKNEDGEVEFAEVEPRIMRRTDIQTEEGEYLVVFNGLEWWNIIKGYYQGWQDIIYYPLSVSVDVRLSVVDLSKFNITRPIYIKSFGRLFYITKMTVKGDIATLDLLRI